MGRRAEQKKRRVPKSVEAPVPYGGGQYLPITCDAACRVTDPTKLIETKNPNLFGDDCDRRADVFDTARRIIVRTYHDTNDTSLTELELAYNFGFDGPEIMDKATSCASRIVAGECAKFCVINAGGLDMVTRASAH